MSEATVALSKAAAKLAHKNQQKVDSAVKKKASIEKAKQERAIQEAALSVKISQ